MAEFGATTHQLICTPEYLHAVKAFGTWSLPDRSNETKNWIENQLDSSIIFYKQAIKEHHWYGFWNYGDVMHTYDPIRHVWRYDIGGFAWDNTELAPGNWLWYSFLRTRQADIFQMAEAMTRHNSEVDVYHIGQFTGLGSRHNVSHWGCGAKEARIGQAAWKRQYYYLTTDERSGDLMRESLAAEKGACDFDPLRIAQPRDKFPYNAPARLRWGPDWLALAGNWMTEWERTGDIKYRDKIVVGLESLSKLPNNLFTGPNGLGYDPATGKLTYDGDPKRTNKNHLATIMGGYEILLEMFDMIDQPAFKKTFIDYCKFYSMSNNDPERSKKTANWGDMNFLTPRLTAYAARELNDDKLAKRAWSEFLGGWKKRINPELQEKRSLYGSKIITTPDVLNPVHENPNVGTNGTAQWGLNAIIMLELIGDKVPDEKEAAEKKAFLEIETQHWKPVFTDNFQKNWNNNWFLDGQKAELKNTKNGLIFKAGATPASDADHAVLWTKQSFEGDLRIEFDFTKKDTANKFVNIIYLFAEGSGVGEYDKDISKWNDLRTIPAMNLYYEHMDAYHISFAAFENYNKDKNADYIRLRRYLPERGKGLICTDLEPEYLKTGLFKTGVPHHITIIRKGFDIYMKIKNAEKEKLCHFKTNSLPTIHEGRIGLRLMGSRVSEFSNFKVFSLPNTELNEIKKAQDIAIRNLNQVVFSDNFDNNSNKWQFRDNHNFQLRIVSGMLHIEKYQKNAVNNGCMWYQKNIPGFDCSKNFSISFDAQVVNADDVFNAFDFQWGNVGDDLYQFTLSDKNEVRLQRFNKNSENSWSDIESIFTPSPIKIDTFNHVEICQVDDRCIILINNIEVMNTQIEKIKGSAIGIQGCLRVSWNMDNLLIKQN